MNGQKVNETAAGAPLFAVPFAPRVVWGLALLSTIAIAAYAWSCGGGHADILFTTAVALTIGSLVLLIFRRVLVATLFVTALMTLISLAAFLKHLETDVTLHAYDVVSLLSSWSTVVSFWHEHRQYAIALMVGLALTGALTWAAYSLDEARARRAHTLALFPLLAFMAWIGASLKDADRHTGFYYEDRRVSFFFSSWPETIEAWWRGSLIDAAAHIRGTNFASPASCKIVSKPPHIILIHQESVVPPSHFPSLNYQRDLDPFFRSHDGKLRKLRVETYGGASWLTEFSVITGISALSFGNLHQFVQTIMAGKVRDTLPQALDRCGYHNVAFHPMLRIYLSIGKFLTSAGMHEVFDAKAQAAKSATERDRFYYSNALSYMEQHFKTSSRPLFTFIETMATHGPYSYTYMPEVNVPGGRSGTHPEMHEYLRRLAMAQQDYSFLRADLARRFPGEQFVIVSYGDHQPLTTLPLLGFREDVTIEDVMRSGNDAALITYYTIDVVNYRLAPVPDFEILDVPYLGTILLESAGLTLSEAYRERKRLMTICSGRYHTCSRRREILQFHRRLIDSGLLDAL